ncbi:SpoIID/LytB domain-containing protein [Candidatus Roizmanbacteria bacterium]|nr:SpoIID/LytB domain-containing protein [Candidatus Roizmanbacteria bacterium]
MTKRIALLFLFVVVFLSPLFFVRADTLDDIAKELNEYKQLLDSSSKATQNNEAALSGLTQKLNGIKVRVSYLDTEIVKKEKEVKDGEVALSYQKTLLDQRVISYYKNIGKSPLTLLDVLVAENLSDSLHNFFYHKSLIDEDKKSILKIASYIKELDDKKKSLESEKSRLDGLKKEVDTQSQFLAGEISKSKKYESELQSKIVALSARQQEIIAQKQASLNLPKSAGSGGSRGCSDDRPIDPGFSPRFAFFTFGAPHRVGMNQYGAKGRAEAGQNTEDILKAYYANFELKKDYDTGIHIKVDGSNEYGQSFSNQDWEIENYVKHVYEMPTDWPMEALKAQAVAARSYALAVTNNGGSSICPSQTCQVVKQEENSDRWKQAVDATRGWVMITEGHPLKAWFASTHGGYEFSSGDVGWSSTSWTKNMRDTSSDINSFQDLMDKAYDKSSPWFYCDWGSRSQYSNTAWLKSEEVADIANTLMLAKADSGTTSHLCQTDQSKCADTWDANKVKDELRNRGKSPFNSVSGVSIDWDKGAGRTNNITISGDAGSQSFSAKDWKDVFNLRAPANIQIVGPLFNVEKR